MGVFEWTRVCERGGTKLGNSEEDRSLLGDIFWTWPTSMKAVRAIECVWN